MIWHSTRRGSCSTAGELDGILSADGSRTIRIRELPVTGTGISSSDWSCTQGAGVVHWTHLQSGYFTAELDMEVGVIYAAQYSIRP